MGKQLTKKEILNAKSVHLYNQETLYVELEKDKQKKDKISTDFEDGLYHVFSSETRNISITIMDHIWTMAVNDFGEACRGMNGKDEYEFYYSLDDNATSIMIGHLREKYGNGSKLQTVLKKEFGFDNGPEHFRDICECRNIKYAFFCY